MPLVGFTNRCPVCNERHAPYRTAANDSCRVLVREANKKRSCHAALSSESCDITTMGAVRTNPGVKLLSENAHDDDSWLVTEPILRPLRYAGERAGAGHGLTDFTSSADSYLNLQRRL